MRYHVYTDARHPGTGALAVGSLLSIFGDAAMSALSTLYADETTGTTLENPYTVPITGICNFWVEDVTPWVKAPGETVAHPIYVNIAGSSNQPSVKDFGVLGDGVTDDTDAIDQAAATVRNLFFPEGSYVYNGDGILPWNLNLFGAGRESTTILLGAGCSLVQGETSKNMVVRDLTTVGGFGAVRFTGLGISVEKMLVVERCNFLDYTGAAVSSVSVDNPFWRILNNDFNSLDSVNESFGISLNGGGGCIIEGNSFTRDRCHIKLRGAGGQTIIDKNVFIRLDDPAEANRIDLWMCPGDSSGGGGEGVLIGNNKFGNENLSPGDFHVLYAKEDLTSGADPTRLPDYTAALSPSTVGAVRYYGNTVCGKSTAPIPFITSYVEQVTGHVIDGLTLAGTFPSPAIVDFKTPPGGGGNFMSVVGFEAGQVYPIVPCNYPGIFALSDPSGVFNAVDSPLVRPGGGSLTNFVNLSETAINDYSNITTATLTPDTDSLGGADAALVTIVASGDFVYETMATATTAGIPIWVECDIKQGGGSPSDYVRIATATGVANKFVRVIPIGTDWLKVRFWCTSDGAENHLIFGLSGTDTGTFIVGRTRLYQAHEPVLSEVSDLSHAGTKLGFYGTAPATKPTVTGSRGANAALASLIDQLEALGLITDSSTAS